MNSYQKSLANLFKAEEEANKTIKIAESKKETILDQAISDANEEITILRKQYEEEFQKKIAKNTNNFEELEIEVKDTQAQNDGEFNSHKNMVVNTLVDRIFNVRLELERNVQKDYSGLLNTG